MYSTKDAITMSLKDILGKLSDYDIYAYYIGKFQVGKLYNSPLRSTDKIPSFAVFPSRNHDLLFKDHGSGQSGNAITFCKLISGVKTREEFEKELLKILKSSNPESIRSRTIHYSPSSGCNIGIVRQPFTDVDDLYWTQFGIKRNTLTKYNVFSIRYFLLNNTVRAIYKNDCPMYAYKVNNHFKIYRPLAPKQTKWRNNMTQDDIQGFNQLDLKDKSLLIITKSMKDVMVLREMGYNAISPSSETTFISNNVIDWCKKTFKHILLLFDRDKTGVQRSRKFSKEYGLDAFLINKRFKAKDISDAVKINGFNVIKNWLDNTLTKYKND